MKEQAKFKITIVDFIVETGKHFVGLDKNGDDIFVGDMVIYNEQTNWVIAYRYGNYVIKQVGLWAMVDIQDWSDVEKQNIFGAGTDNLIVGYVDEPFFQDVKHLIN